MVASKVVFDSVVAVVVRSADAVSVESSVVDMSRSAVVLHPNLNARSRKLRRCAADVDPLGAVDAAERTS